MIFGNCRECGSSDRVWMHAGCLASRVKPEDRAEAMEAAALLGADCEAWLCRSCDHFGIIQVGVFMEGWQ